MTSRTDVVSREADVLWRRSSCRLLLMRPEGDEVMAMDAAGVALWTELAVPSTVEDVAARLGRRYRAAPEQVLADVLPVIEDLAHRRLVCVRRA